MIISLNIKQKNYYLEYKLLSRNDICMHIRIQASAKQPAILGKCFATLGIIESFSLFAFVFALILI